VNDAIPVVLINRPVLVCFLRMLTPPAVTAEHGVGCEQALFQFFRPDSARSSRRAFLIQSLAPFEGRCSTLRIPGWPTGQRTSTPVDNLTSTSEGLSPSRIEIAKPVRWATSSRVSPLRLMTLVVRGCSGITDPRKLSASLLGEEPEQPTQRINDIDRIKPTPELRPPTSKDEVRKPFAVEIRQ